MPYSIQPQPTARGYVLAHDGHGERHRNLPDSRAGAGRQIEASKTSSPTAALLTRALLSRGAGGMVAKLSATEPQRSLLSVLNRRRGALGKLTGAQAVSEDPGVADVVRRRIDYLLRLKDQRARYAQNLGLSAQEYAERIAAPKDPMELPGFVWPPRVTQTHDLDVNGVRAGFGLPPLPTTTTTTTTREVAEGIEPRVRGRRSVKISEGRVATGPSSPRRGIG